LKTYRKTENNQSQPVHRILIVDDESKVCNLLARIMEQSPHVQLWTAL